MASSDDEDNDLYISGPPQGLFDQSPSNQSSASSSPSHTPTHSNSGSPILKGAPPALSQQNKTLEWMLDCCNFFKKPKLRKNTFLLEEPQTMYATLDDNSEFDNETSQQATGNCFIL